ncbi:YgaP family membrane protein [Natrarchaeobaculum aegyptiacum]|uniref:Inner membrane protein YgaP-like transmembrane domain-containing protein n=1 Tax=Natrarchaeobaculum aegyptiacum TaxID=745377 RepID=A0A2Z2HSE8_9EURY|nr:DUF2892 domain-containing protein [Natrarchaeobaculum aegyptiacum]ARS90069.1 hypothetical protein B1756_10240 [Natrarchaeobaculum aegyptiacum]
MERNVGGLDRIARGALGVVLVVAALSSYRSRKRNRAAIAGIAGIGLLVNAVTCFCGANYALGIDTTSDSTVEGAALEETHS